MDNNSERQWIIRLIKEALQEFYSNSSDRELVEKEVDERAVAFRFGIYLDYIVKKAFSEYVLDSEYNKIYRNPKKAYGRCSSCVQNCPIKPNALEKKRIRPDFLIHKRFTDENFCCIELKTRTRNRMNDIKKLTYLTCLYGEYQYKYGVFLRFFANKNKVEIIIFESGNQVLKDSFIPDTFE